MCSVPITDYLAMGINKLLLCTHTQRIIHKFHKHNFKWYMPESKDHIPFLQNSEAGRMTHMIKIKSTRIGINFIRCLLKPCTWKVKRRQHHFCANHSLYICRSYYGINWLPWLWRLRSPTVSARWTPGKAGGAVWRPENWRTNMVLIPFRVWRPPKIRNVKGKGTMSSLSPVKRENGSPPCFCSLQALNRLDDAHAHWGEK